MVYTMPGWAKDQVRTDVQIMLCFKDKLKVLFGAPLSVEVYTSTENEVGRAESQSKVHVGRLIRLRKGRGGYSLAESPRGALDRKL